MHSIFEFGQDVVIAVLILIGLATALQLSLATSRARSVRLARPGESALKAPALLARIMHDTARPSSKRLRSEREA